MSRSSRLTIDLAVIAGFIALSLIPAAGTRQQHFATAAASIRILAAGYALIAILSAFPRHRPLFTPAMRRVIEGAGAVFVAAMAASELAPAGNHVIEIGIYIAMSFLLFVASAAPSLRLAR
jgi:hypothetical protein